MKTKTILVFSPAQPIQHHAFIERKLMDFFAEEPIRRVHMGCNGVLFDLCTAQESHYIKYNSPSKEKLRICQVCKTSRKATWRGFEQAFLDEHISEEDKSWVNSQMKQITPENISTFSIDGFKLGRFASYNFILRTKVHSMSSLSDASFEEFKADLRHTLFVYKGFTNYLKSNPIDLLFLYNPNYNANHVVKEVCKSKGIPFFYIHAGSSILDMYDGLYIFDGYTYEFQNRKINYFIENVDELNLPYSKYQGVLNNIAHIFKGSSSWVYSQAASSERSFDIERAFKLDRNKPTALFSMSSIDEAFAYDFANGNSEYIASIRKVFADQIVALSETIRFFAKNPQWQLIVRVHPREFPNKREGKLASAVEEYNKILSDLPPNVVVNLPEDKVSIYDLFEAIHLNITSWTVTGLESASFGIPTISTVEGLTLYPGRYVNYFPSDATDYFDEIGRVLCKEMKRDLSLVKKSFQWYLYDHNLAVLRFSVGEFWKYRTDFFSKVSRRLKRILKLPNKSYSRYSSGFRIEDSEKKLFQEYTRTFKPIFEQKAKFYPKEDFDSYFDKYFDGLIGILGPGTSTRLLTAEKQGMTQ
jgi:hypothetical protein